MTPSCPTSPSLLPMISRRAAHPGHTEEALSSFDYLPNPSYVAPSYAMQGQFEATLQVRSISPRPADVDRDPAKLTLMAGIFVSQSSEFLRSMFSTPSQRNNPSPFQQLTIPANNGDSLLLPAHQIISPASSVGSGSSGPSSPSSGPYTPNHMYPLEHGNAFGSHLPPDASLEAQAQAEMNLQADMQMQQEFAAFTWDSGSLWANEPAVLLTDDFDINAIPPIDIGIPKYTENLAITPHGAPGLDFGHDFVHALEGRPFPDDDGGHGMNLIGFDEMMAGHGF